MSALIGRSDRSLANEFDWFEFSDRVEISPASIWAVEDEDEITVQSKRVAVSDLEQVTTAGIDESATRENPGRARVLDEWAVLPSEASFATVVLNQPTGATSVERREHLTVSSDEGASVSNAGSRARILDESAVLPVEASFDTVVLNQPIVATTVERREHLTLSSVEGASVSKAGSRARILDESAVLPGEASFDIVMLNQRTNARTYSPLAEFLVRSNLNWRRLNLVMLVLVSISAVIMLLILTITHQGVFSPHSPANTPAQTLPRPTEPDTARLEPITPQSSELVDFSDARGEVSALVASTPETELEVAIETQKKTKAADSEPSQRVASDDANLNLARKVLRQDAKSVASKAASAGESSERRPSAPQRQAKVTEITKSATPRETVSVDHAQSEIVGNRGEAPSSSRDEGPAKAESKSVPPTGGGQRPRRVTP